MSIKISYHDLPEEIKSRISEEVANSFLEYRQDLEKKYRLKTQRAFEMQMKKALKANEVGMTPEELIEFTAFDRQWVGINISYTKNYIAQNMKAEISAYQVTSGAISTRNRSIREEMNDKSWCENQRTRDVPIHKALTDTSWSE